MAIYIYMGIKVLRTHRIYLMHLFLLSIYLSIYLSMSWGISIFSKCHMNLCKINIYIYWVELISNIYIYIYTHS